MTNMSRLTCKRSIKPLQTYFCVERVKYFPRCHEMNVHHTGENTVMRDLPANTKHLYNICTTSAQRLRRWANIVQMLHKCFVLTDLVERRRGF